MTDVESFKRQTGVKIEYREFGIDELAPAPILQPPPPAAPSAPPSARAAKPPAPPGAPPGQEAAPPAAQGFARYAPPPASSDDVLLSELFKRLER